MDEAQVEEAMHWCRRSGKWAPGADRNFLDFVRMLQEVAIPPRDLIVGRKIGKGTFGSINRATLHGRKVAVKFVGKEVSSGPKALPQVMHELMLELLAVKSLEHPAVCRFEGASARFPASNEAHRDWSIGLIFELCEGGDLHNKIKEKIYFSISQKLNMLAGVASGIAYLHSLPIVHRDLSSRNLLLTSSGNVKICDFGCARIMKDFSYHPSFISGSPPWMAPEQIFGKPITLAVDVYAFGAILWELFTGKLPFQHRMSTGDIESLQRVCRSERGLSQLSDSQLGNLNPELKSSISRLLSALHHANPVFRPDAERVRQIVQSISETYDRPPKTEFNEKHYSKVLQEVDFRAEFGRRIAIFDRKHNPGSVKTPENLHKTIEKYAHDLDAYNEALQKRYKADLNSLPGVKPLVHPFAKTDNSQESEDRPRVSRIPPHPADDHDPVLRKQNVKAVRSANPPSSGASSGNSVVSRPSTASSAMSHTSTATSSAQPARRPMSATANGGNNMNLNGRKDNKLSAVQNKEQAEPRTVKLMDPVSNQAVTWQEFKDPASGDPYYYNITTNTTQWSCPIGWPTADKAASKSTTATESKGIVTIPVSPSLRAGPSPSLRAGPSPSIGPSSPAKEATVAKMTSPSIGPSDIVLPADWCMNQCAKTGRTYYSGQISGRLQWNPPTEPDVVPVAMVSRDADAQLLAERSKVMEARLRSFYAMWGVTNKDKDVPLIVAQYVKMPSELDSILRQRFYGTDLSWGRTELEVHVRSESQKAKAAALAANGADAANGKFGSVQQSSDGRSTIVC